MAWPRLDASGRIEAAAIESGKYLLKWQDWAVIVFYLALVIGIGGYFYLRERRQSTSDFFVGGRSIPFWAAGISLYATNTSSISFIAIPAKAFETNWQYMTNNLIAVVGLMFVAVWIVPLLRRLNLMSVFSYLETRFHPAIRMLASALCIAMQVGARMSVILFLPALAIATITGISVALSVVLMGVFTIIYTAMGGMKAVIWTDVVQVIVKMGGAIFAIGFIIWHIPGGAPEFWDVATANQKMKTFDFSFDLTKATVWGFIFLVLFDVVLTFPKDQVLMQRTLSTPSDKEAGRSIWAFAAIMIPGGLVFYSIGTALFVYYKAHPERLNPTLPIDATFPLFIAAELPTGVTGLIVAGIFAAAMATLSSIMNSVATLVSVDFYERLVKAPDQRRSVLFAEITTVVVGLVGIGLALLMSRYDIHSLFDVSIELAGLLGGGFAGSYTLGMFTRRANSPGVAIGIGCSIVLTFVAWWLDLVHPYFYLAISILLSIVIGYLASLCFPAPQRSLKGLTIYRDAE
ncbi:sodium:solute symporter [Pseudoxanthomonas sp. UC19_8]|uniref:sodium:solute symporter n=1 Tax=Pseudoxanthomonas sp. UC19_8 TaxID=3350175 RepID=UPI0036D22C93